MAKQILILEDEKDVALLYAKRLENQGYQAHVGFNGLEGLAHLKKVTPDLILLDINMPEMGGLEFYQHICGNSEKPPYPVLVLSARIDLEAFFRDFNVDGFITKPFDGSRLLKEVDIILKQQYKKKRDGSARTIAIVDDVQAQSSRISEAFAKAGFKTQVADSGVSGIDKIMANPPDLALIKLGLKDLSGDLVVLKLQQMAKTKGIPCMIYAPKTASEFDKKVMGAISNKTGIRRLCEYDEPSELIEETILLLKQIEKEEEEDAKSP